MGRNIFQSESPVAMIQAIRAVVQGDATPKEALQLFETLKKKEKPKKKRAGSVAAKDDSAKV